MTIRTGDIAPPTAWDTVAIVFLCGLCAAFSVAKLAPALPSVRASLSLTMANAGFIAGSQSAIAMVFGVAIGLCVAYINERRGLVLGMGILAISGALGGFANNYLLLLSTRVMEGLGLILIVVSAPPFLRRHTSARDSGLVFGVWSIYMALGSALMIAIAPALLRLYDWRSLWAFVSAAAAMTLLLLLINIRNRHHPAATAASSTRKGWAVLRLPPVWLLAASSLLYVCQFVTLLIWLPSALMEVWEVPVSDAAVATAVLMLCNAAGSLTAGHCLKGNVRWDFIVGAAAAFLFVAISLATLAMWYGLPPVWPALVIIAFMFAGGFLPPAFLAGVSSLTSDSGQFSCGTGLLLQGSHLGQFVGPAAFGYFVGNSGHGWLGGLALLCAVSIAGGMAGISLLLVQNKRLRSAEHSRSKLLSERGRLTTTK